MNEHEKCIECFEDIPNGAKLCSKCGSYQSKWKNRVKYFATVIGIVVATFTALAYLISVLPEVKKILFWKDSIEIMELSFAHKKLNFTAINSGDGKVQLSYFLLESQKPDFNITQGIDEAIPSGEMIKHRDLYHPKRNEVFGFIGDVTEEEWSILQNKSSDDFFGECFRQAFYTKNHPRYLQIKSSMGNSLKTWKAKGTMFYYSLRSAELKSTGIDLIGALAISKSSECESSLDNAMPNNSME